MKKNYIRMINMSNELFDSGEIAEIDKLDIRNPLTARNYVYVYYTLTTGISGCSCVIGDRGTYIQYNDIKYKSENDYYRLQNILEKEKIKKLLDRL